MSPFKLSLVKADTEEPGEAVELDDSLVAKLQRVVDAHPGLTMAEALRQGIEHVAEHGPRGGTSGG